MKTVSSLSALKEFKFWVAIPYHFEVDDGAGQLYHGEDGLHGEGVGILTVLG